MARIPSRNVFPAVVFPAALLLSAAATPALAAEDDDGPVWTVQIENDFFAQLTNTDRHYTNGLRISRVSAPGDVPGWLGAMARVPSALGPDFTDSPPEQRWGISVGHSMFTPDDTDAVALVPDDRPYAAWLYLGLSVHSVYERPDGAGRQDTFAVEAGIVGPSAKGEQVQNTYHDLINVARSFGWDNQLRDEPGVQFVFERKWRSAHEDADPSGWLESDVIPHVAVSLGNVMTDAAIGMTLRYGHNLHNDFGPPRIRPGLPGSESFDREGKLDWYIFTGLEGRYVAHNIFLDGNTWKDSHSVDRRPFVLDAQLGFAVLFSRMRLTYTHVIMSPEFNEQRAWDHFGALTVAWKF